METIKNIFLFISEFFDFLVHSRRISVVTHDRLMMNKITKHIDNSLIKNLDHLININIGECFFPIKYIDSKF